MSPYALVEKWRASQLEYDRLANSAPTAGANDMFGTKADVYESCADELESALAGGGEAVAWCQPDDPVNRTAFSWPGAGRNPAHTTPLFTQPSAARVTGEPVGYIAQSSIDALNACRNDEHNGYANIWMRPRDSETIPLFTHPAGAVQIPEGYVLLPRRLTAENGAKGLLSGEFAEGFEMNCGECDSVDEDTAQHCDVCNGHGTYRVDTPIGWNTIKDIYRMIVDNLALNHGGSRE